MENTERFTFFTATPGETTRFGEALGRRIRSGLCISFVGSLGAGKTVMIGGVCRGLDVDEAVLSPTFVLYEEFAGRLSVVHVDLYRLEHETEIEELGVFGLLGGDEVILAEWGDRSEKLFARSDVIIKMDHVSETVRKIEVSYKRSAIYIFKDRASWLS